MLKTMTLSLLAAALLALPARAGEATCGGGAACCNGCEGHCPQCGCCLVPVCHPYCTTKKVTEYEYTCTCEDICIPGRFPRCESCEGGGQCNKCNNGETCNGGCQDGCYCGHCRTRSVAKLVKYPVTKEVPVRKCTVEWVCPHCGSRGNDCK